MSKKSFIIPAIIFLGTSLFTTPVYANELDNIRAAIQSRGARWEARETSISKLELEEKKMLLGALKPVITGTEVFLTVQRDRVATIPARFDWRNNNGENFVTPVRNQRSCGSCWAFATTAALEAVSLIAQRTPGIDLNLAEQILVRCSGAGDCQYGGYPSLASNFVRDYGLPVENCYPYTATDGSCAPSCPGWQADAYRIKSWAYVTTWSPSVYSIKSALYNYGPLPTTMDVYHEDFRYYNGGVYSHVYGGLAGGHAIVIVGYDDEEEYFIVKNSWGTAWGESGYFKIDYSQLTNEVEFGYYTMVYETEADIKSRLTVLKAGAGQGNLIADGLTCYEEFCEGDYLTGTTVTVTALADPGFVLGEWTGCDSIVDQSCIIAVTRDITATATFLTPPRMSITPRSVKFGSIKIGAQSSLQSLIVQNNGGAQLSITSLEIAGANGSDFSFQNNCSQAVAAGQTCTIEIAINPSDYGKRSGELKIYSNDTNKQPYGLIKMTANGKPPKIRVKPSLLRFEPVKVSSLLGSSSAKSIVIENLGLSDLVLGAVKTDNITDFSLNNNCLSILESGASCTMDVVFLPRDVGTRTGFISIDSNDPKKSSVRVKFAGKGE